MDHFIYEMPYVSLMVTTKQKARIKDKEKGNRTYTTTENHQFTKVSKNKGKRNNGNENQ